MIELARRIVDYKRSADVSSSAWHWVSSLILHFIAIAFLTFLAQKPSSKSSDDAIVGANQFNAQSSTLKVQDLIWTETETEFQSKCFCESPCESDATTDWSWLEQQIQKTSSLTNSQNMGELVLPTDDIAINNALLENDHDFHFKSALVFPLITDWSKASFKYRANASAANQRSATTTGIADVTGNLSKVFGAGNDAATSATSSGDAAGADNNCAKKFNRAAKPINVDGGKYPIAARKARREGVVVVNVETLKTGRVGKIELAESSWTTNQGIYGRQEAQMRFFDDRWETTLAFNYTEHDRDLHDDPDSVTKEKSFIRGKYRGLVLSGSWKNIIHLPCNTITFGMERQSEIARSQYNSPWTERESVCVNSVYLQDELALWKRFFLTLGGRCDNHEMFGSNLVYNARLAAIIPSSETKLFGGVGTGFRAPSIYELTSAKYGNPQLCPEKSRSFEVGLEQPILKNRLLIGAAYFNQVINDQIVWDRASGKYEQSVGESLARGVESFISVAVKPCLDFNFHYTFTATEGADGLDLRLRPEHKWTVKLGYHFFKNKDGIYRGVVSPEISYIGRQREWGNIVPNDTWSASRVVARIAASYQIDKHFKIKGRIENVFNKRYEEPLGYAAPGIGAYLGLEMDW